MAGTDSINYDVIILGAGPAGLSAANEFVPYLDRLKVGLFDKSSLFGGAGGNTDNKWNILRADASESVTGFWHMIDDQGGVWSRHYIEAMSYAGAEKMEKLLHGSGDEKDLGQPDWYEYDPNVYHFWNELSKTHSLSLEKLVQFHIGSERGKLIMQRWGRELQNAGIDTHLNEEITSIEKNANPQEPKFIILTKKGTYYANEIIIAKGRSKVKYNDDILVKLSKNLGFDIVTNPIDIGLRIEFLPKAMEEITRWKMPSGEETNGIYDPKFRFHSARGDWVRTFCSNLKGGKLSLEKLNGLPIVNGESDKKWYGQPANMALLETTSLKEPNANPIDWAMEQLSVFDHLTTLPDETSRVMIQRLGDFLGPSFYAYNPWIVSYENGIAHLPIVLPPVNVWSYRRSRYSKGYENSFNRNGFFKTTLETDKTLLGVPGDFHMAFNSRICDNLRDSILALGSLFPETLHPSTVLAGPEIKMYAVRAVADGFSETKAEGVRVAGDGGRGTHGIAPSVVNGMNAAHGILLKYGYSPTFNSRGKEYTVTPELVGKNVSGMI